jgi:hypothetical protein
MRTTNLLLIATILVVGGCVSVPIPPFGDQIGEMGTLKVSLKVDYLPKQNQQISSPALDHAWDQLIKSRTIKDK